MSPHRTVRLQRWQVTVFLLALIGSFVWVAWVQTTRIDENKAALISQQQQRTAAIRERKLTDQSLCRYVRDHVVKPDRDSVLVGPLAAVPSLRLIGTSEEKIDRFLNAQYGGVPVPMLTRIGIPLAKAKRYARGKPDGVAIELRRRPVPDCSKPLEIGGR